MSSISNSIKSLIILLIINRTSVSYNQPKICSNATWNPNGITFVNISVIGGYPRGFFIDFNNRIFVAAHNISQILKWTENGIDPVQILSVELPVYPSIFVTINGDIYFENGTEPGRIDKLSKNSTTGVPVKEFTVPCRGLFIDINNTLYCSSYGRHTVFSTSLNDNNNILPVAGTDNDPGSSSVGLIEPHGIFVDTNFDLYVADTGNCRIQRFLPGESNGTTVAGKGIPQNLQLNRPTDVVLDSDRYLFIADNENHRIIRVGVDMFECIIGCTNHSGAASNEFNKPYAIRFDSYGNLYVADEFNYRIQKFMVTTNSCDLTTMSIKETTQISNVHQPSEFFYPEPCENSTFIGSTCNISNTPCNMLKPCLNNGSCVNNATAPHGYSCLCLPGFNGTECQYDYRPCQSNTCWNDGTCYETSNITFICKCVPGWQDNRCQTKINYCENITCSNNGVCQPLLLNYSCKCVSDNYSGRHCEITATKIIIYKIVSKSFAYVAIIAMISVAMFVVIMDILKYCFGIDPVHEERVQIRRKKLEKKQKATIQRCVSVNAPPVPQPSENRYPLLNKQRSKW